MTDDDDTKRQRKPPPALSSAERRARSARAVPVDEFRDVTSPIHLLSRLPDEEELAIVRDSPYEASDPVPMTEFAKLLRRIDKLVRDEKSNNRERNEQLVELLKTPPGEVGARLREEVKDLSRDMKVIKWAAGLALTAALGSLASVITRVWDRAEREGETTIRLKHIESAIERLQDRSYMRPYDKNPKD